MDCLAECLQSTETKLSVTTVTILKELLPSRSGKEAFEVAHDSSKRLLKPFVDMERKIRSNEIVLSNDDYGLGILKT